jgi:hypothetical protein
VVQAEPSSRGGDALQRVIAVGREADVEGVGESQRVSVPLALLDNTHRARLVIKVSPLAVSSERFGCLACYNTLVSTARFLEMLLDSVLSAVQSSVASFQGDEADGFHCLKLTLCDAQRTRYESLGHRGSKSEDGHGADGFLPRLVGGTSECSNRHPGVLRCCAAASTERRPE